MTAPIRLTSPGSDPLTDDRRLERATWAFVALGVLLRVARYLMDYPLWWDEAFLAVNFIRRGYLDLLRPLDYNQVCPILFLWIELTVVKLAGLLRVVAPAVPAGLRGGERGVVPPCGRPRGAGRAAAAGGGDLRGELPPDPACRRRQALCHRPARGPRPAGRRSSTWWRNPERTGRLWALAAVAPIAVALSHPAIFVAGGIAAGLAPAVVRAGRRRVWIAYASFVVEHVGTFLALYAVFTAPQASSTLSTMQAQWTAAFPPLDDPRALVRWLATVHTGGMFAYPCGGESGASSLTLLAVRRRGVACSGDGGEGRSC